MIKVVGFMFVLFFVSLETKAGVSEQWVQFKESLVKNYLPVDQETLTDYWKKSVPLTEVHTKESVYIRKHGPNRIVTHYFISKSIEDLKLPLIEVADKKVAILDSGDTVGSYKLTVSLLKDEEFLQYHFLNTFELYVGDRLPESERISFGPDATKKLDRYSLVVLARRREFRPIDKKFNMAHWDQLRSLVVKTPFDLGWSPNLNFGLTAHNSLVIFDTEPGAYRDGRNGLYHFVKQHLWVKGQEDVVEFINFDLHNWQRAEQKNTESREDEMFGKEPFKN